MDTDYYLNRDRKIRYNKPFCDNKSDKNCPNCGMEINNDNSKCPFCGAQLRNGSFQGTDWTPSSQDNPSTYTGAPNWSQDLRRVNQRAVSSANASFTGVVPPATGGDFQQPRFLRNTNGGQLSPRNNQLAMQARGWTVNTMAGENRVFPNDSSQADFMRTNPNANSMDISVCSKCGDNTNGECRRCSGFMKDLMAMRDRRIKTNANNVYYDDGCPALMEDGRFISTWRPSNEITEEIGTWNNIGNSNQLRLFLQTNGMNLAKQQNAYLTQTNSCNPNTACSEGYYDLWMKGKGGWDPMVNTDRLPQRRTGFTDRNK